MPNPIMKTTLAVALWCGALAAQLAAAEPGREAELIAVLASEAQAPAKADACRELARIGTAAAVPALASLLADEKLEQMARFGLETIPGKEADAALIKALATAKGRTLTGVVASIGVRKNEHAVAALGGMLKNPDPDVQLAAARSLGMIGDKGAVKTLHATLATAKGPFLIAVCDGLIRCAETYAAQGNKTAALAIYDTLRKLPDAPHQVIAGAWRGAILHRGKDAPNLLLKAFRSPDPGVVAAATGVAGEITDPAASKLMAAELAKASAPLQIQLCFALGARRDASTLPALITLAKKGTPLARAAAIGAITAIGHADAAPALVELLMDPEPTVAQGASFGLASLPGPKVDKTVTESLDSPNEALKLKMIEMIGQRRMMSAMPKLLAVIGGNNEAARAAAINVYTELATEADLTSLLDLLAASTQPAEIAKLERALGQICGAAADREACVKLLVATLAKTKPATKPALLRTLRVTGGPDALKAVRSAVNDADKDVHSAAIRTLAEWNTGEAAPILLEIAKNSSTPVDKILSLRGYLGMVSKADLSSDAKLAICREAAALIERNEEKVLLLGALANLGNPASVDLAAKHLNDPALKNESVGAVMAIAGKRQPGQHAAITRTALEKVIAVSADNADITAKATELLKKLSEEK